MPRVTDYDTSKRPAGAMKRKAKSLDLCFELHKFSKYSPFEHAHCDVYKKDGIKSILLKGRGSLAQVSLEYRSKVQLGTKIKPSHASKVAHPALRYKASFKCRDIN